MSMYFEPTDQGVTRFPTVHCLGCGAKMDATSATSGEPVMPTDGDVTLCLYCAEPQVFVINSLGTSVRPMTAEEHVEFEVDHGVYLNALRELHKTPQWQEARAQDRLTGLWPGTNEE